MLWIQVQFSVIYTYWGCYCKQSLIGRRKQLTSEFSENVEKLILFN